MHEFELDRQKIYQKYRKSFGVETNNDKEKEYTIESRVRNNRECNYRDSTV